MGPGWWKRCPTVVAPLVRPSISTGTISDPSRATMPWSGRTQRRDAVLADAAPQRIDLGQGKARTIRSMAGPSTSAVGWPGRSIIANSTPPRSTSASRESPVLRRNPSSACGGADARGPLISSDTAAVASGRPRAIRPSRRGVAKVSMASAPSPALASSSANRRARSLRARACMRAGISSERSSSRKSALTWHSPATRRRPLWQGRGRGRYRPGARPRRSLPAPAAC